MSVPHIFTLQTDKVPIVFFLRIRGNNLFEINLVADGDDLVRLKLGYKLCYIFYGYSIMKWNL